MIGMLGGAAQDVPTQIATQQQAALFGGGAGTVFSTGAPIGTSVGPGIPGFLRDFQAGQPGSVGGAVATLVGGGVRTTTAAAGPRVVTRRQFILMQARAFQPGATAKKIVKAARDCGMELAAATFGLNILDVCFLISEPPRRRRRGITAADMRTVGRTARKFQTLEHNLAHLCGPRRTYRKKK